MFYLAKKNILRSKTEDIFWAWFIEKVLSWFPEIIHFALSGKYDFVFLPIIFLRFVEEKNKEQTPLMISFSILTLYNILTKNQFALPYYQISSFKPWQSSQKKWTLSRYQKFHANHFQISRGILFVCWVQADHIWLWMLSCASSGGVIAVIWACGQGRIWFTRPKPPFGRQGLVG